MILKNIQYKIIREYFQLNENLDSPAFKSFVSDLEQLDLDTQKETIKNLQKFIYKKTKEINKKKKKDKEVLLYDKNKVHIEKIKDILKSSYLKKIDFQKNQNFNHKREYTNSFNKRSLAVKDQLIENKKEILIDYVNFKLRQEKIYINVKIEQFFNYTENTIFTLSIRSGIYWQPDNDGELEKFKNSIDCDLVNMSLEYLNERLTYFKEAYRDLNMYLDALKYNL